MAWIGTKTWNTGDPFSAPDHNNYTNNNMNYIAGDPTWTPMHLSLINGFVIIPGDQMGATYAWPAYRQEGNWVRLRGWVQNSSTQTSWGNCFILPLNYHPLGAYDFPILASGATNGLALASVNVDGSVNPNVGTTMPLTTVVAFDLSGICFSLN